jgi:hypothetical protein
MDVNKKKGEFTSSGLCTSEFTETFFKPLSVFAVTCFSSCHDTEVEVFWISCRE